MSGNMLLPCRADEHEFCQRALNVHDELQHSPDLLSKTCRFVPMHVTYTLWQNSLPSTIINTLTVNYDVWGLLEASQTMCLFGTLCSYEGRSVSSENQYIRLRNFSQVIYQ